jgi:predicted TIM-barrel fold metal-dependent hydrolase
MIPKNFICDCHVHVTPDGKWFDTDLNASLDRLLVNLNNSPIGKVLLLPVGREENELKATTNFIISLVKQYPETMMGFSAYYKGLDITYVLENQLSGIKIHPRQNKIDILDKELFTLYESASCIGLPILFDGYCTPISDMPIEKIRPLIYRELAITFPSLKIILAHCGMPFIWETYTLLKWFANVFADLSHILKYFKGTSLMTDLAWVVRKIPHKFLYGSDFPEMTLNGYFKEFQIYCETYDISATQILNNFHELICCRD